MAQQKDQFVDPTGCLAESTLRIQDLHQVEKVIHNTVNSTPD
jgi:hypothetical protein